MRPPSTTVKTLRSFLACLMAIVLSVGLTPAMPREASATEGDTAAEASVRSTDWQRIDECEWRIDEAGCLTIRPADGAASGTLSVDFTNPNQRPEEAWPWDGERDRIQSITITKKVIGCGSLESIFIDCYNLVSVDLSGLDTSNVTNMSDMFRGCKSLASLEMSGLDTSNVTNMSQILAECESLTSLDLSGLDTSNATNMRGMFHGCESLTSLDLSGLDTSNATNMRNMFAYCSNLTSLDVSGFDTSNARYIDGMFDQCSGLTSLDVSGFDTSNVTNMGAMFNGCLDLTYLDVSKFDTSKVTNMGAMFGNCGKLTTIDTSKFDTSKVTDMGYMFAECHSLTAAYVSNFDTSNVTDMSMMFRGCNALNSLDLSNFATLNVTDMGYMFYGCEGLSTLDLSNFDTSSIKNIGGIFGRCISLARITFSEKSAKLASELEIPDTSISGSDGYWYNSAGQPFLPSEIPTDVADTYYASKQLALTNGSVFEAKIGFKATVGGKDAYTTVKWDDGWFDQPSTSYATMSNGRVVYNEELHGLATTASVLSAAAYNERLVKDALVKLGFKDTYQYYPGKQDYMNPSLGSYDQVAYTFGIRETSEGVPIVAVVVRGTAEDEEWLSNLAIGESSGTHEGFLGAAAQVFTAFNKYITGKKGAYDLDNAKLLVTGHSRGAAVANILGATFTNSSTGFLDKLNAGDIYDFTFATPTTVLNPQGGYDNIFNIVNIEDIVTKIPLPQWGYGRYGRTLVLPSSSNTKGYWDQYETMNEIIKGYTSGESYEPFGHGSLNAYMITALLYDLAPSVADFYGKEYRGGLFGGGYTPYDVLSMIGSLAWGDGGLVDAGKLANVATIPAYQELLGGMVGLVQYGGERYSITDAVTHAHMPETYISWMQAFGPGALYKDSYKGVKVACPVDVRVYDEGGKLVASIVDDVVDESIANGLPAVVFDGVKMVDVPSDGDYRIEITAREAGEMDFTVEEKSGVEGAPKALKAYQGVKLEAGKSYTCALDDGQKAEDAKIVEAADGSEPENTGIVEGQGSYVEVSVEVQGEGDAWGGGSVLAGSQTTVRAAAADGSVFDGWYVDGSKASEDAEYTVRANGPMKLVAVFKDDPGTTPDPGEEEGPSEPSQPANPSGPTGGVSGEAHAPKLEFDASKGAVTVSPDSARAGATVTVSVAPLFGFEVGAVTATSGVKGIPVEKAEEGAWTFKMPDGDVSVSVKFVPSAWDNPFPDVGEGDWFYDAVRRANLAGLMNGYDGVGLFGPDDGLAREQAATVMWNLMGMEDAARPAATHSDVVQGEWYAPQVNWAVDAKVMDGYDAVTFGVGDELTREQFAAVIAKAIGADVDSADQTALGAFQDADGVSGWAQATMAWAVENGVLNGVENPDGSRELQATRTLTRAEMATMMMNAIDKGVLKLDAR